MGTYIDKLTAIGLEAETEIASVRKQAADDAVAAKAALDTALAANLADDAIIAGLRSDLSAAQIQIGVLQAQIAANGSGRPTGPGYVRYEDLKAAAPAGATLQQVINTVTDQKIITFPLGVFETTDTWGKGTSRPAPLVVPATCGGFIGSGTGGLGSLGTDATVFRLKPLTCTSASEGGSWFQANSNCKDLVFKNFQVQGTDQGKQTAASNPGRGLDGTSPKVFTNLNIYHPDGTVLIEDVLSTGWYGNNGAPPGETFGVQVYMDTDNLVTMRRVEADGRREVGGPSYGAVGITLGDTTHALVEDCYAHHNNGKTYAFVLFQCAAKVKGDIMVRRLVCNSPEGDGPGQFGYTGGGVNQERVAGAVYEDLVLNVKRTGPSGFDKGVHFNHSGDSFPLDDRVATMLNVDFNNAHVWIDGLTFSDIWNNGYPYFSTWGPNYGTGTNALHLAPHVHTKMNALIPIKWKHAATFYTVTTENFIATQ